MSESTGKPLRRSTDNHILAGICGGLGEFFGINPIWFRLAFLISAIPGGFPGIPLYIILWIIIPKA
jgi:phage shock protein C